jgi:hypothetical protein
MHLVILLLAFLGLAAVFIYLLVSAVLDYN